MATTPPLQQCNPAYPDIFEKARAFFEKITFSADSGSRVFVKTKLRVFETLSREDKCVSQAKALFEEGDFLEDAVDDRKVDGVGSCGSL
jgi:hypothetical protein